MPVTTRHQSHPNPNKVDDPKSSSNDTASTVGNRRKRQESNADVVDAPKRHKKQTKKGNGRKTALERAAEDVTSSASGVPPHLTPAEHTLVAQHRRPQRTYEWRGRRSHPEQQQRRRR
ncbi:hypothetical protein BYT27DRAFT_7208474 [Phlegmacium glaucopus]|nr:hypothetical protein BYT27DRAFT_7208474 [Phlegmacium glaucopus]